MNAPRPALLIVDDDEGILNSLRLALSHAYDVMLCDSAAKGIVQARANKPAAIILDIKMPGQDGFWMYREVRKFDTETPIIFNSGYQDVLPASELASYTPFAYLPKSGGLKELLRTLSRAVAHAHASR